MPITRDEVHKVATLARLRLTDAEESSITEDLDHILAAFVRLQQLDTTGVEPTACVDDFGGIFRPDVADNAVGDDTLLENAPARDGRYFRVPKVLD